MSVEVASIMGSPQLSPRGCVFPLTCVSAAGCYNKSSCEVSASPKGSHYFPTAASLCWALGMPLLYGKKNKTSNNTNKPTKNKTKKKNLLEKNSRQFIRTDTAVVAMLQHIHICMQMLQFSRFLGLIEFTWPRGHVSSPCSTHTPRGPARPPALTVVELPATCLPSDLISDLINCISCFVTTTYTCPPPPSPQQSA